MRFSLSHLALNLHPLHLGQRSVVVQHLEARQCVVGLRHLRLGTTQQVAGLRVVHLRNQLTFAYGLTFVHQHPLDDSHACKAHSGSLSFFHNSHISLSIIHHTR